MPFFEVDNIIRIAYFNEVMQTSQQINKTKIFHKATARQRLLAGLVLLAVAAFFGVFRLAATGKINLGRWIEPCGVKQRYGLTCPTCSMTTSTITFAKGKIFEAFYIQPAAAFFCCVLVVIGLLALLIVVLGLYPNFISRFFNEIKVKYIILSLLIIVAAGWAVTLARALAEKS